LGRAGGGVVSSLLYILVIYKLFRDKHSNTDKMDFSQFNGVEQAHMTKVIEKKQVRSNPCRSWKEDVRSAVIDASSSHTMYLGVRQVFTADLCLDARLYAPILWLGRKMLQRLCPGLHQQGIERQ
jgi:hypothetical protein